MTFPRWRACPANFLLIALAIAPASSAEPPESRLRFRHHFIARDLPGDVRWGYGTPGLADFDSDGDIDICSKIWKRWPSNANNGKEHVDFLNNLHR